MVHQILPSAPGTRETNPSHFDTFAQTADLLKDSADKAMELFSKAPKEARDRVYGELYSLLKFAKPYWGCAEDAFHDKKGLSSTPEQKTQAIQNYLIKTISAANLGPGDRAGKHMAIHILLTKTIDLFGSDFTQAMNLFSRLPAEAKEGVHDELYRIMTLSPWECAADAFHHEYGLTSTSKQKIQAIQNYQFRAIANLLKTDPATALGLFSRMPKEDRDAIVGELYNIRKPFTKDYYGCAEHAFYGIHSQTSTPEQKIQAIQNHLIKTIPPALPAPILHPIQNGAVLPAPIPNQVPQPQGAAPMLAPQPAPAPTPKQPQASSPLLPFQPMPISTPNQVPQLQGAAPKPVLQPVPAPSPKQPQAPSPLLAFPTMPAPSPKQPQAPSPLLAFPTMPAPSPKQPQASSPLLPFPTMPIATPNQMPQLQGATPKPFLQTTPAPSPKQPQPQGPMPKPAPKEIAAQSKAAHIRALEAKCPQKPVDEPVLQRGEIYIRRSKLYSTENPIYTLIHNTGSGRNEQNLVIFDDLTGDLYCCQKIHTSLDALISFLQSTCIQPIQPAAKPAPQPTDPLMQGSPLQSPLKGLFYNPQAPAPQPPVEPPKPAAAPMIVTEPALNPVEAAYETEEAQELFAFGTRSILAQGLLSNLSNYKDGLLEVGKDFYLPVTGNTQNFSTTCVASVGGSSTREITLLNPKNSPWLAEHFAQFRTTLRPNMTTFEVLSAVKGYIRNKVFPSCLSAGGLEAKVDQMVNRARLTHPTATNKDNPQIKIPLMPIDDFIKTGLGVCRHHALVTVYFIDGLLSEEKPLIEGTVQHIRGNIDSGGAHAWTTLIPMRKNGAPPEKYHLDTLWDVNSNFAVNKTFLNLAYGPKMIADQVARTNNAAKKNQQPEG